MSELIDKPTQIQDKELAREVANAEKPGRDYLKDNPDLPRDRVIQVATEIGAASMHAALRGTDEHHMDNYHHMPLELFDRYEYTTIPKPEKQLTLIDDPRIAEWAKIPGIKCINKRPVVNSKDMFDFALKQLGDDRKSMGRRTWNVLRASKNGADYMEYTPDYPLYDVRQAYNSLQYFDEAISRQAGLREEEHVDLFSLYEATSQLLAAGPPPKGEFGAYQPFHFQELTATKIKFLTDFIEDTLRPNEAPRS